MRVFSHYEEVFIQVGVSVIGIPEFVVHKVTWYKDINILVKPLLKKEVKNYNINQRKIQKFSSTRPNRKKDKV